MILSSLLIEILLLLFFLLLIHYLIFLSTIYSGLKKLKASTLNKILDEFVSIIIPFRNEKENILNNLKSIEAQYYPKDRYEVIFVNDSSQDDSLDILLKNKSAENIKVISVPEEFSPNAHKKRAVRYGIENSKGEIIVTTDADCIHGKDWLNSLVNNFYESTGFVSGPVEFLDDDTFFSKLQKLEFAGLIITGAGLIGSGKPTICNAANIAYRKKVFDEVGGFKNQMDLSSGDDELLMQKISKDTDYKVKFSLNQDSIVKTPANKTCSEFYHQRKRWASKGLFYRDKTLVFKLVLIYLFFLGFIAQLALALSYHSVFYILLAISFLLKTIFEFKILSIGRKKLFSNLSLKYFLISELIHIPYIIIAGLAGAIGNYFWKERKIKR